MLAEQFEVAGEIGVEAGVEEADLCGRGEFDGANGAGVGDDGQEALFPFGSVLSGARDRTRLHVEDAAGEGCAGAGDFDVRAADCGVEIGIGGVFA